MSPNRRFDVTGLEEPEELWERLNEANDQIKALSSNNKKLSARVRLLERQLSEVGGLTEDELIAEVPRRIAKALESAQGLASEIIRRANQREVAIRQQASVAAVELRKQAEAEAAEIRRRARADAASCIAAAKAEAQVVVTAAQSRRDEILSKLREQSLSYERQIGLLRERHTRLAAAYDVVERTLTEARTALQADLDPLEGLVGMGKEGISSEESPPRMVDEVSDDRKQPASLAHSSPSRQPTVYDWSPVESHVG